MTFFSLFTASGHIYRHVCYKHAITVLLVDDDSVVLNNLLHANQWYTHILLQDGPLSWFNKKKKNAGSSAMWCWCVFTCTNKPYYKIRNSDNIMLLVAMVQPKTIHHRRPSWLYILSHIYVIYNYIIGQSPQSYHIWDLPRKLQLWLLAHNPPFWPFTRRYDLTGQAISFSRAQ